MLEHELLQPLDLLGHVLLGHVLDLGALHIRNVTTDLRGPFGEGSEADGNSIFIFEAEGLCIVHLGHLHHTLTPQQLAEIGRIDVVLVPVDGSYTLDMDGMIEVLQGLKAPLMIPMQTLLSAGL